MTTAAISPPPSQASSIPSESPSIPMKTVTPGTEDASRVSRIAEKFGLLKDPEPAAISPPENTPPPSSDTPPPAKDTPPPAAPPAENPNATAAARRVAEKAEKAELEALRLKVTELEKLRELEPQVAEYRTRAEQNEAEATALRNRYQNEVNELDPTLISEVPVVREAYNKYNQVADNLFPVDISNPMDDEPDMRFDAASLSPERSSIVRQMLDNWEREEFHSKAPLHARADVQHVLLSNIAAAMGVDTSKFSTKIVNGVEYNVISPNHPVYKHLKQNIRPFVQARQAVQQAEEQAKTGKVESLRSVVGNRVTNTKNMIRGAGVGLTGEDLSKALEATPDSPILRTMKMLEGDADLLAELREAIESEASVNGHFRPQLDLVESDLNQRNTTAQTFLTRIGMRAVHAPLAPVLMKLSIRQQSEIETLRAENAALKAENDSTLRQAEPGSVTSTPSGGQESNATGLSEREIKLAKKFNLI